MQRPSDTPISRHCRCSAVSAVSLWTSLVGLGNSSSVLWLLPTSSTWMSFYPSVSLPFCLCVSLPKGFLQLSGRVWPFHKAAWGVSAHRNKPVFLSRMRTIPNCGLHRFSEGSQQDWALLPTIITHSLRPPLLAFLSSLSHFPNSWLCFLEYLSKYRPCTQILILGHQSFHSNWNTSSLDPELVFFFWNSFIEI